MRRCIELVESRTETVELDFQEAQLLVALGRRLASQKSWWAGDKSPDSSIVRCEPSGTQAWRVTVFDAVGSVTAGDLQLIVTPKIATAHVLYLLEHSELVPRVSGVTYPPENGGEKRVGRSRCMHHEPTAAHPRPATFNAMCLNGQEVAWKETTTGRRGKHDPRPLSAYFQKHADFDPR